MAPPPAHCPVSANGWSSSRSASSACWGVWEESSGTRTRARLRREQRLGSSLLMADLIDHEEMQRLRDAGAQIVEVLPEDDYRELHVAGAINIPLKELDMDSTAGLDKTNPVVVYCWDYL